LENILQVYNKENVDYLLSSIRNAISISGYSSTKFRSLILFHELKTKISNDIKFDNDFMIPWNFLRYNITESLSNILLQESLIKEFHMPLDNQTFYITFTSLSNPISRMLGLYETIELISKQSRYAFSNVFYSSS
jgi:hypothetical protein